jgi:hypothetical protein
MSREINLAAKQHADLFSRSPHFNMIVALVQWRITILPEPLLVVIPYLQG